MPSRRLTLVELRRQIVDLKVGASFSLVWADPDDHPDQKHTWAAIVQSKPTNESATYTSVDADDTTFHFQIPSISENAVDEGADDYLDIIYYDLVIAAQSAKKTMASHKKKSVFVSSICAWKRNTWTAPLNMPGDSGILGRELVVSELRRQLNIPERALQSCFGLTSDHERCALGEALFGVVALIAILDPASQGLDEIDQILNPILRRLCEHRAGDNKNGKERTEAMDKVRKAFTKNDFKNDDITQAMLGYSAGTHGT